MRVNKDGKVRLEKGEIRVGNFFVRDEGDNGYISAIDLNSCFKIRIQKRMPLGIWLGNIVETGEAGHSTIKTWVAVMWSLLSVVPDDQFVKELMTSTNDALNRHPDWYGFDPNGNDDEAANEVREMVEFEQAAKEIEGDEGK